MCAIFGTAGIANLKLIKEISQKQIFRGPDEQKFFVSDDNLDCLGNNRLSVKDKQNRQFSEGGLYVREDDQDWGSAGMNDIQQDSDIN